MKLGFQLLDLVGLRLDMLQHLRADSAQLVRVFGQGFEGFQHVIIYTRLPHAYSGVMRPVIPI